MDERLELHARGCEVISEAPVPRRPPPLDDPFSLKLL
jgi:hypothetical protein